MTDKAKRPKDPNQLAKSIVDIATREQKQDIHAQDNDAKDPAAVSLGRRGGLKGGVARAQALTPSERQQIARRAAQTRWKKDDGGDSNSK